MAYWTEHDVDANLDLAIAARLLAATPLLLREEISGYGDELARWHPGEGEWCANEVVGHLIEAELRGFAGRIRTILANDHPSLQNWDQDEVARQRRDCEKDPRALLDEFAAMRAQGVELVRTLEPGDVARGGLHPLVGELTVGDLLYEWVHHDRNHLKQIMTNVQLRVWPAMGNAQRFSLVD